MRYPKILLITSSTFNSYTGTGITLSNLFKGWPQNAIAIIHQDKFKTNRDICVNEYRIGECERKYNFPFSLIFRNKVLSEKKSRIELENESISTKSYRKKIQIKRFLKYFWGYSEIIETYRLSDRLREWLETYGPDIIYAHFSSLESLRFASTIILSTKKPYAVHFMDDFYNFNYTHGLLSPYLKYKWKKEMQIMVENASLRMGISEKMCRVYETTFKVKFYPFFNAVDVDKWNKYSVERDESLFQIVYAGTLNSKNIESLEQFAKIVSEIKIEKKEILLRINSFVPRVNAYKPVFEKYKGVLVEEVPIGDSIIPLLKNSSLLLLPIDFTSEGIKTMKYSMLTKVPAYMASGTPILLWGSQNIAVVEYALEQNWAYVVSDESTAELKIALVKMMNDERLRQEISANALRIVAERHDSKVVSREFQNLLINMSSN